MISVFLIAKKMPSFCVDVRLFSLFPLGNMKIRTINSFILLNYRELSNLAKENYAKEL